MGGARLPPSKPLHEKVVGTTHMSKIIKLLVAILACQIAGVVGSIFTAPSIPTWYATLKKPDFTPPNWVFAPVWTTLFVLMGVSA